MVRTFKDNLVPLASTLTKAMNRRNPHILNVTVQNNGGGDYVVFATTKNDLQSSEEQKVTLIAGNMDAVYGWLTGALWAA